MFARSSVEEQLVAENSTGNLSGFGLGWDDIEESLL